VRLDPVQTLLGTLRLGEAEHRCEEKPLPAAVVGVVEVPVYPCVTAEQGFFDPLHQHRCTYVEVGAVRLLVGGEANRLGPQIVRVESFGHAPKSHGVHPLALFPPVDAGLAPVVLEPARHGRCRLVPAG